MKTTTLENHARDSFDSAYSDARKILIAAIFLNKNILPIEPPFSLAGGAPLAIEQALNLDRFPISVDRFLENQE